MACKKNEDVSHALLSCEPFGFHKLVVLSSPRDFLLFEALRDGCGFCLGKHVNRCAFSNGKLLLVVLLPRKKHNHDILF
jgi:hypothetical protein